MATTTKQVSAQRAPALSVLDDPRCDSVTYDSVTSARPQRSTDHVLSLSRVDANVNDREIADAAWTSRSPILTSTTRGAWKPVTLSNEMSDNVTLSDSVTGVNAWERAVTLSHVMPSQR